jgi:hypothetical protein
MTVIHDALHRLHVANEKGNSLCLADTLRAHRGCDRHWIQACHVRPPARRIR